VENIAGIFCAALALSGQYSLIEIVLGDWYDVNIRYPGAYIGHPAEDQKPASNCLIEIVHATAAVLLT
jgi:hypothetical protein